VIDCGAMKAPLLLLLLILVAMIYGKAHTIDRSVQPYTAMNTGDLSYRPADKK